MDWKRSLKKTWYFIWEDNSIWSWLVNIVLAFLLIKFLVYPSLGFALGTSHPVVAVVSGSMEHKTVAPCEKDNPFLCLKHSSSQFVICGTEFSSKQKVTVDFFWKTCGVWYQENANITEQDFQTFSFRNGFDTGDIMVLRGTKPENIKVGDIIVYQSTRPDPIIHRVVKKFQLQGTWYFQTKGDHNAAANFDERRISEKQVIGKAALRIPLLGWIKIEFVRLLSWVAG
jgi:signal peptidase I